MKKIDETVEAVIIQREKLQAKNKIYMIATSIIVGTLFVCMSIITAQI